MNKTKKMCVIFDVNENADLSKVTVSFKDKNGSNPYVTVYRNVRAIPYTQTDGCDLLKVNKT